MRRMSLTSDVDKKQQRNLPLGTELNEVRRLQRTWGEKDAIISNDTDLISMNMCKALQQRQVDTKTAVSVSKCTYGNNRGTVFCLKLSETTTVNYTCDDIFHIERLPAVSANNAIQFRGRI